MAPIRNGAVMARAASRGKRKSTRSSKTKSQQGGILPWAALAVVVVGGILAYDNWWKHPAAVSVASTPAKPLPSKQAPSKPAPKPAEPKASAQSRAALPVPPAPLAARPISTVAAAAPVPNDRPQPASTEGVFKTAFGFCGDGTPRNCVVDGGTFWHRGVKIRVAGINAPQVDRPGCEQERQLGVRAKVRLLKLLNEGPIGIDAGAAGRNGEANMRTVRRDGRSLGNILISEGLAQPAEAHRPWC